MQRNLPRRRMGGALAMLAMLPAGLWLGAGGAPVRAQGRPRHLVVIPKSSDQLFWDLVRSGVEQAARQAEQAGMNLTLTWRGPAYSGDADAQIRILQSYTRPGVDAILLAADDRSRAENWTGCGNTVNCNHPVVRDLIVDALCWWVTEMHVDGFRFDLAAILSRGPDGTPLASSRPSTRPALCA